MEAAFNMPQAGGGIAFFGTYMFGCSNADGSPVGGASGSAGCDPSWNEIDEAFLNASGTLQYITSLFISKQPWSATCAALTPAAAQARTCPPPLGAG